MQLHLPTLALIAVFVTAILGVLLLLAWRRDQGTNALVWWGLGYLIGAASFGLLSARGAIPDVLSIHIANTLLLLGYGIVYAGMRAFGGRETPVTALMIAPLIWLTAMQFPAIAADIGLRILVVTSMQAAFVALMAHELWRERAEPLLSRWPTIIVLVTHILMLTARMIVVLATPVLSHADVFRSPVFALMAFGTVLYTITLAFLLLSMSKERSERHHKIAALVDPLTGLANRRAFMADAEGLIAARSSRSEPLAVLVADLDHFKKVNDEFGHAIGDQVLRAFANTVRRTAGVSDLTSRLGGEEFAVLLPGRSEGAAIVLAERIRRAFAEATAEIGGHAVAATVSIGVAASRVGVHDLAGLIGQADRALYQAKESGRNRVAAFAGAGDAPPLVPDAEPVLQRRIAVRA